jgi:hypothetical protein
MPVGFFVLTLRKKSMSLTFSEAIEILEITDISKIIVSDIPQIERKAKKKWHPDRVAHLKNEKLTQEYAEKFQKIEEAGDIVRSYLDGTYHAGEASERKKTRVHEEPEVIIRRNAPSIQQTLKGLWALIQEKKYKLEKKQITLSNGFKLKDWLAEDFREDIAMLSIISFFYGLISFSLLILIFGAINHTLGTLVGIVWLAQALSCVIGFLPLSRFWLPEIAQDIIIKFINFGLAVYNTADRLARTSSNLILFLLTRIPEWFAFLVKYIILMPLYELAKLFIGDKVVGVVKKEVNYYAGFADWYIVELTNKDPELMLTDELFDLSSINSALSDIKANI